MNYSYADAQKKVKDNLHQKGKFRLGSFSVTHILIAPADQDRFNIFMKAFVMDGDGDSALIISGHDPDEVRVLGVYYDGADRKYAFDDLDNLIANSSLA